MKDSQEKRVDVPRVAYGKVAVGSFALALAVAGCTSVSDYIHNGFKVGPNYHEPPTPVADDWIRGDQWKDADDDWIKNEKRIHRDTDDLSQWWTVFKDPVLNDLICYAYKQNLNLKQAYDQVRAARAVLGETIGNLLPQTQYASINYTHDASSERTAFAKFIPQRFYTQWNDTLAINWELDFWGLYRRAIETSKANWQASVHNYDAVLVSMLGDVATNYVNIRVLEQRIKFAQDNAKLQRKLVDIVKAKVKLEVARQLDLDQARALLYQTEATIPLLEIALRQANNALCTLLGIPPEDLSAKLGPPTTQIEADARLAATMMGLLAAPVDGPLLGAAASAPRISTIPIAPTTVCVGIPADLLRRRPDVRKAERLAAAQCAQIGVAEAEFYPHCYIVGTMGYSTALFKGLFSQNAIQGGIAPTVQWNFLQYGRILNNMRVQDATFQQTIHAYQQAVLNAQQDVENSLISYLKADKATLWQELCVIAAESAAKFTLSQYDLGLIDITQVILIQQNLVVQQDTLAQVQGQIPLGLISVYRALGGGWELRKTGCEVAGAVCMDANTQMPAQPQPQAEQPRQLPNVLPSPQPLLQGIAPPE